MTYGGKKVQHLNEIKNKSPFCLADLLLTRADLNSLVLVVILFIFLYFAASLLFIVVVFYIVSTLCSMACW